MIAGTATPSDANISSNNSLRLKPYRHDLLCGRGLNDTTVCSQAIHQQLETLPHSHHFVIADDASEALRDFFTSSSYARNKCAVCAVDSMPSSHPASSLAPHTSGVAAIESDAEGVVKVCTDDDTTGEEVAVSDLNSQSHTRQKV